MINDTDIRVVASERMTDNSDGGGKMTGNEILDGVLNNVFPNVSSLDRVYGRVSIIKVFVWVDTANVDEYLGAHVVLTDPPDDTNIVVTMFTTGSWTDERDAARNMLESYSIQGPESPWILYGDHVIGQRLIMAYSQSNTLNLTTPSTELSFEVGTLLFLSVEKDGFPAQYQAVRVTKILSRITTKFTDSSGDYFKDVLIFEVGSTLNYEFPGATPTRIVQSRQSADSSPTLIRTSSVADANRYAGVLPVTQAIALNDIVVKVDTPYAALVPSARSETPLVDINANMTTPNYVQSGAANSLSQSASFSGAVAPDYAKTLYMGRGVLPGTLALTILGTNYKDSPGGILVLESGALGSFGGTIDYASGKITVTYTASWSGVVSATATPAVAVYSSAGTVDIPVTISNRALSFVQTLAPIPAPGSLVIDYKALDKWYRLTDDGQGHIAGGSAGIGTGTVNYATGSVLITLAALPDIDSSIIYAWASPAHYNMQTYVSNPPAPSVKKTLANLPVQPGTLVITWTDGVAKTASAALDGTISGDATGSLVASTGELEFFPVSMPASGTSFTYNYQQSAAESDTFTVTGDSSGTIAFTLAGTPVKPGSVKLSLNVTQPNAAANFSNTSGNFASLSNKAVTIVDDGAGGWVGRTGTINYSTGECVVDVTEVTTYNSMSGFTAMDDWS